MNKVQCKEISTDAILRLLATRQGRWSTWFPAADVGIEGLAADPEWTIWRQSDGIFPPGCSEKLVLAKMRQLLKNGFISGCGCSCRGDFEITDKGLAKIGAERVIKSLY